MVMGRLKARTGCDLRHCVDPRARCWARAEFFCSALDWPWLANNDTQLTLVRAMCTSGMDGDGDEETQGQNELRLRHCLDPRTRRWARAEFFCSALDRPWLANNGVQELCDHCNISPAQLARLSRREWGCIRKALGRPRRLSLAFLRQVQL